MRFVIVGPAYPIRGGIAQSVTQLYKTLCGSGHDVHVLSFKRLYPNFLFPGTTQFESGKPLYKLRSKAILDSINPLTWIHALIWLQTIRPTTLIFQYWMPFFVPCYVFLTVLAKIFWGVQVLYICHNIIPHEQRIGDSFFSKLGLKFVDGFITQSLSVHQDLLTIRPDAKIIDVPHPVYTILPDAIPKQEARNKLGIQAEHIILYFGIIRPYKGVKYLVQAMPEILKHKQVQCFICGEFYEERDETIHLIRDLNLEANITVQDQFIPNETIHLYFCAADLVVLPYVTATQSGVVQVAYNYNRPVLVTDVGGLPEVVQDGHTGYVVPPKNPDAISKAVLHFFRNTRKIPFEKNIKSEKSKYSWEQMGEAVVTLAQKQCGHSKKA
ncbi:glycosyltransferase [bacterium]